MDTLDTRLGGEAPTPPEHAVIVEFDYGLPELGPMIAFAKRLESAIAVEGTGEFDGYEIAMDLSHGTFWMYGEDADDLFFTVRPVLLSVGGMRGAWVTRRYGPPEDGVREETVELPGGA